MRTRPFLPALLVTLAVAAIPARPAHATIDGFILEAIREADEGWSLDDRIGATRNAEEHIINIQDCLEYKGHTVDVSFGLDPAPLTGDEYSVKLAEPGGSCPTDDLEDVGGETGGCELLVRRAEPQANGNEFEVDLDALIGASCDAGSEETTTLYIVYQESGATTTLSEPIDFVVDLEAPAAPTNVEAFPGESSSEISWTDDVNTEERLTYRVYYRAGAPIVTTEDADGSEESGEDADSLTVSGLDSNETYYFRVTTIDPNDNESELSADADVSTTTVPATDFWELYKDSGGDEPGGFCFIATAAYGTPLAEDVDLLRRFRDEWLLTSGAGRSFVSFYYEHSPPIARAVRKSPALAAAVRVLLLPLVFLAWFLVELGLVGKLLLLATGWAALRAVRTLFRRRWGRTGPALRRLPLSLPPTTLPQEGDAC